MKPNFFGLTLMPNLSYTAQLDDDLNLTRMVLDPEAKGDADARLFIRIDGRERPYGHLDALKNTTLPLNLLAFGGSEISFRVAGKSPIHISGYYFPEEKPVPAAEGKEAPQIAKSVYDLGEHVSI